MLTNMLCYASDLGDCSNIQSGEHLVSKGLFGDSISVQGLHWCRDEVKTIGINSIVSNILCSHHNSALSSFDVAAIKLFDGFRSMSERENQYKGNFLKAKFGNKKHNINGKDFEKWATKTFLNIMYYSKDDPLLYDKNYLLQIVYRQKDYKEPYGLHTLACEGQQIFSRDHISIVPIINSLDKETIGMLFEFRGFFFMLQFPSISGKPFANEIKLPASLAKWNGSSSMWHPKKIVHREKSKRYSDIVELHW